MGRSRYKIYESSYPHFFTCTILHWLLLFSSADKHSTAGAVEQAKALKEGYTQGEVARFLGVSAVLISYVFRSMDD